MNRLMLVSVSMIFSCFPSIVDIKAQDLTVDDISPYFCGQLDGTSTGNRRCEAPYAPYAADACEIYEGLDVDYAPLTTWFEAKLASCSAEDVEEAKVKTLKSRASLRGYVTSNRGKELEDLNDPISTPEFRPNGANRGAGEVYFAAECIIQRCG